MLRYALAYTWLSAFDIPDLLVPVIFCSAEPAAMLVQEGRQTACNHHHWYTVITTIGTL